jgi:flagellar hook assembly protein FlgD
MKKIMMMIAMLAIPFAMQAQKFHDVEANDAKGAVKSITTSMMGQEMKTTFSEDGKMTSGNLTEAVYDENGYIKSAKMDMRGQSTEVKFTWENGRLKTQTMSMMGNEIVQTYNYDEEGHVKSTSVNFGGQAMEQPVTEYKFDEKGNWISRKTSMMGQEMKFERTIEYY